MDVGGIAAITTSRKVELTQPELEQHAQYRLDFIGAPCQMITAASDDAAKRKVFTFLGLPAEATPKQFVSKGGRRLFQVSENRQVFPPMHH